MLALTGVAALQALGRGSEPTFTFPPWRHLQIDWATLTYPPSFCSQDRHLFSHSAVASTRPQGRFWPCSSSTEHRPWEQSRAHRQPTGRAPISLSRSVSGMRPGHHCHSDQCHSPNSPTSQEPASQTPSLGKGWMSCAMVAGSACRALSLLTPQLQEPLCQVPPVYGTDSLRLGSSPGRGNTEYNSQPQAEICTLRKSSGQAERTLG